MMAIMKRHGCASRRSCSDAAVRVRDAAGEGLGSFSDPDGPGSLDLSEWLLDRKASSRFR